jgi:Family of unknown function (DUF6228)
MPNTPSATIFSSPGSPHVGRIEFSEPAGAQSRGYFKCEGTLEIDGEEWSVAMEMISPYRSDMLGFFEELGAESTGWVGEKVWESEFAEMSIRAANAGEGEAVLHVHIRWPPDYGYGVKGTIHVRADELPRFAERMRAFLRLPEGGERFIVYDEPR